MSKIIVDTIQYQTCSDDLTTKVLPSYIEESKQIIPKTGLKSALNRNLEASCDDSNTRPSDYKLLTLPG